MMVKEGEKNDGGFAALASNLLLYPMQFMHVDPASSGELHT